MKNIIFMCLAAIIQLSACKKDNKESTSPTLEGKWTVDNRIFKEYTSGALTNTYTETGDGTTWDFQNTGKVVIANPGSTPELHTYFVQPDSKVNIDGFVFEIRNLGSASVTLFIRHDFSSGQYDEVFTNLKR